MFPWPEPQESAAVLAIVKAKPSVAAHTRPALTPAARDGAQIEWSGRENGSAGVELENVAEEHAHNVSCTQ